MNGKSPVGTLSAGRRRVPAVVLLLAAAALSGSLGACTSNGTTSSSSPSPTSQTGTFNTATATQQVTQTWETFFSKDTPLQQKAALLENGSKLAAALQAFGANPTVGKVTADVKSVTFPSPTKANVTYSISLNGRVVESDLTGNAVYQNGKWLVADTTLCGLLQLAAGQFGTTVPIPGCGS